MVSTLLMTVGLPQSPEVDRVGWAHAWHAAFAFDRVNQRSFFTTDEGTGTDAYIRVEAEIRS